MENLVLSIVFLGFSIWTGYRIYKGVKTGKIKFKSHVSDRSKNPKDYNLVMGGSIMAAGGAFLMSIWLAGKYFQ